MKKNRLPSPASLDDLRATWLAELTECEKRRSSLSQQISRAHRAGDSKKVAALTNHGQDNFFEKLAVAKKEILQDAQFRVKAELMWYRASLNWSSTPGQKRHTIQ